MRKHKKKYLLDIVSSVKKEKEESTLLYKLFSGSTILLSSAVIANILSYLFHLGTARLLPISEFGALQSLIALINMLTIVTVVARLQLTKVFASLIAKSREDLAAGLLKRTDYVLVVGGLVATCAVFAVASLLNVSFGLITPIQLSAVAVVSALTFVIVIHRSYLRAKLRFFALSVNTLSQSALRLAIVIPILYLGYKLPGALVGIIFAYLITYVIAKLQLRQSLAKSLYKRSSISLGKFGKESAYTMVGFAGLTLFVSSDLLLVQYFVPEEAGFYAALMLFGKVMLFLTTPISAVLFPILVSSRKAERGKIFWLALLAVAVISALVLLAYTLFPEFIVSTLLSASYLVIAPLMPWYGLFVGIYVIVYAIVNAKIALNDYVPSFIVLAGAIAQAVLIVLFHDGLDQVVAVSLVTITSVLLALAIYQKYGNFFKVKQIRN